MAPRFDLVGIVVADMAASLSFYRQLGLEIPPDSDGEPHVEATLPSGVRFAWDLREVITSFDTGWKPPVDGPGLTLDFACDSPADVDATFASLVASGAGAHHEPWDAFWGQRYATVTDPDGNHIDLFAAL
jgi:catechol 2,3-dioxygenase-like lactoylglutathione lyase family enzyme